MKEENWFKFKEEVLKLVIVEGDVETMWSKLCDDIKNTVEKCFPEREKIIKYKFEMSRGLLKSKNKKKYIITAIQKRPN